MKVFWKPVEMPAWAFWAVLFSWFVLGVVVGAKVLP